MAVFFNMQDIISFIEKNVISPSKEMLAYEVLWAIHSNEEKTLKEKALQEMFVNNTPSEALKQIPHQLDLFSFKKTPDQIKNEVQGFLDTAFCDGMRDFSIVVNKAFQYPENLRSQYPIGLFYCKGNLDILETPCISIVGSRKPSAEGIKNARNLSKELSDEGFTIVSGLALGIDTVAHQSAIDNNKLTIGVIGTPINKYYPKENKNLQDKIAKDFLLISQVPFYKYAKEPFNYRKFHFPRRNKTMASISKATVIVEAGDTSGSLVQARECFRQNKKLFIMDSCFDNLNIKWPSTYEKRGAIRVKETSDILKHIDHQSSVE